MACQETSVLYNKRRNLISSLSEVFVGIMVLIIEAHILVVFFKTFYISNTEKFLFVLVSMFLLGVLFYFSIAPGKKVKQWVVIFVGLLLTIAQIYVVGWMPFGLDKKGRTMFRESKVIIDRQSGEFLGRLPQNKEDIENPESRSVYPGRIFNPYTSKIVNGLYINGSGRVLVSLKSSKLKKTLKIYYHYIIPAEEYELYFTNYENDMVLENSLGEAIKNIVTPPLNLSFQKLIEELDQKYYSAIEILLANGNPAEKELEVIKKAAKELVEKIGYINGVKIKYPS